MSGDYPLAMLMQRAEAVIDLSNAAFDLLREVARGETERPAQEMRRAGLALVDAGLQLIGHSHDAALRGRIEQVRAACAAEIEQLNPKPRRR